VRVGDLSRLTGVPVPTIKYYLREGLLPAGRRTSPNQVQYADSHVRRLKLIRAMLEVGGLSVAATRDVLSAVDTPGSTVHAMLGAAQAAVTGPVPASDDETGEGAEREVAELVRRRGWQVKPTNPGWGSLTRIVRTFRDLDQADLLELLNRYAAAAEELAGAELAVVADRKDADSKVEGAILGTVLGDSAMAALRRLAQEDISRRTVDNGSAAVTASQSA
jgi:DNA-binding transcriptional MerR regulator